MQEHSPLGASGAYRWMVCAASPRMSEGVDDPESEFAALGTAAHSLLEVCLKTVRDAWEFVGVAFVDGEMTGLGSRATTKEETADAIFVDKDMADAVQVCLDYVRNTFSRRNQGNFWIERRFHCGHLHPLMWGRSDVTCFWEAQRKISVLDYKHGAGIVVNVERNPQLMYYALGMLEDLDLWEDVDEVELTIVQPRGWMEPIRTWSISTDALIEWAADELFPAMRLADRVSRDTSLSDEDLLEQGLLASGDHCRFCPARYRACPKLMQDMEDLDDMIDEQKMSGGASRLTNEEIGRLLALFESAKIFQKAARETGFMRAQQGNEIPGWKLAKARANRVWKDEETATAALVKKYGNEAYVKPKLLSPAQVDALPEGQKLSERYAHKPDAGLQLVQAGDARQEQSPSTKAMFEPVKQKRSK